METTPALTTLQVKSMQRLMSRQANIVLLLLAAALPCTAGAPADPAPPGFHNVTIGSGNQKSVIRVADSATPHMNDGLAPDSSPNAKYDPEAMNFNQGSPLAGKTFSTSFVSLSKSDNAAQSLASQPFATHSFATSSYNQPDRKYQAVAYQESSRSSDGFSKTYELPTSGNSGADASRNFAVGTSEFQGKTALEAQAPATSDPFAKPSSMSEKTFFDPMMKHVKRDPYATGLDVKHLTDLPNRPLTIDEVRNLINHEQIPDLNTKPDEPSRALNDPDWAPEATPAVSQPDRADNLPVAPTAEFDKDNELPSPGEMAQPPENSEALPKR
jgi:hypothetical protein